MDLDTAQRTRLAADLLLHLAAAIPDSEAIVRGSLADGHADAYSDIDLLWDVPDTEFTSAISELPAILARVGPVASLRFDPDFQHSANRRLVFVRFADVPLFWRVDLDVFARSVGRDPDFDRDNPAARGGEWLATESALMNAVAAIKACRRGCEALAADVLRRAERRVGLHVKESNVPARIMSLVDTMARQDAAAAPLAAEIRQLMATLR